MNSKTKQTISLILFGTSVLSLTSGFLILILYSYLIGAMIAMFVTAIICFIVAIIIYPRELAELEAKKAQAKLYTPRKSHRHKRKTRYKDESDSWREEQMDEDLEFLQDEEDYEEFEAVDK